MKLKRAIFMFSKNELGEYLLVNVR